MQKKPVPLNLGLMHVILPELVEFRGKHNPDFKLLLF